MCVSAVTDELIAEGSMEITRTDQGTINMKITDKNGYPVINSQYVFSQENSSEGEVKFYRLYSGQLIEAGLTFKLDYTGVGAPVITATDVRYTKTEAAALLNEVMRWDEWVVTEVKTDKWGSIKKLTFDTQENVSYKEEEAKRLAKSKEMAGQLIA